ncbi:inactive CLIP domain-containing serine protease A28-like isoform X2 [Wyeomyia smithii]|uniref:inactive CLIP domain-containing serine protease A28-like isoform X2 n=1 Tax=Wyeomyia smithii TaxID=174621 RepID=UPI002467FAD5|nr:inactive CLIP domain-containing serine protease A28-like isoform X2 [Wyeomyia smithii]
MVISNSTVSQSQQRAMSHETEFDHIRVQDNTFTEATDDSPDCICVPSKRCKSTATGKQARDALCGSGNTCCRRNAIIPLPHAVGHTLPPPPTQPTTTPRTTTTRTTTTGPLPSLPLRPPADLQTPTFADPSIDASLLLEITALLDQFNGPNNQLELEAEFIFDMTPSVVVKTTPAPATIPTTTTTNKPTPLRAQKKCGQRRAALASRIHFVDDDSNSVEQRLSGTVNFAEFPWTVYIEERLTNGSFLYKCGGALISSGAVVTAGHCVANGRNTPQQFRIIAGDWDRRHRRERLPDQQRLVDRIVLHPNYYSGSLFNDIAVLVASAPFNDSLANVASVCLPSPRDSFSGSSCILTGWGASPATPEWEEPIQQYVSMSPLTTEQCNRQLQSNASLGRRFQMHDSFLCAGGVRGLDSCKGSGGSPLICERNGAYLLVGVMSWGVSCGQGVPGVFAGVPQQVGWIREVIGGSNDDVLLFA